MKTFFICIVLLIGYSALFYIIHSIYSLLKGSFGKFAPYVPSVGTSKNTMLDIAWDFSLPTAVFFLIGLISTGRMLLNENKEKRLSCVPFACFVAGLLHMTMEASLITGALDYTLYFLLAIFCGKALLDSKTEDKKEGKNDEPAPDQHNRSRLQR